MGQDKHTIDTSKLRMYYSGSRLIILCDIEDNEKLYNLVKDRCTDCEVVKIFNTPAQIQFLTPVEEDEDE